MEEQLISYETAKLAKEKGISFETFIDLTYAFDRQKSVHKKYNEYNVFHPDYKDRFTPQPTQSLLQKWLREVHNIHILITLNQFGYGYHYGIFDTSKSIDLILVSVQTGGVNFKYSYEQALEAGLVKALNLIKND